MIRKNQQNINKKPKKKSQPFERFVSIIFFLQPPKKQKNKKTKKQKNFDFSF